MAFTIEQFARALEADIRAAWENFRKQASGSPLVLFGTSVSGETGVQWVVAVGKTQAHFDQEFSGMQARGSALTRKAAMHELRLACYLKPAYMQECDRAQRMLDDRPESEEDAAIEESDRTIHDACLRVMRKLDAEGLFGLGSARHQMAIGGFGADVSEVFRLANVRALNPAEVLDWFEQGDPRAAEFQRRLDSLSPADRVNLLMPLWCAAVAEAPNKEVQELATVGIDRWCLGGEIESIGPRVVPVLMRIIEHEVSTSSSRTEALSMSELAHAAIWMLCEIGEVGDTDVERLRKVLRETISRDTRLARTTPFSENLARVLHKLRPARFPTSSLHPRTNHLMNPDDFTS